MARHIDATSTSWMMKLSVATRLANLIPAVSLNRLYDFSHLHDTQWSRGVLRSRDLADTRLSTDPSSNEVRCAWISSECTPAVRTFNLSVAIRPDLRGRRRPKPGALTPGLLQFGGDRPPRT